MIDELTCPTKIGKRNWPCWTVEIVPVGTGRYGAGGINVVPKRERGERKKLCSGAQQKTHAVSRRAISQRDVIWVSFFSFFYQMKLVVNFLQCKERQFF